MIDYLRGTVEHIEADYIVLDVRGVGYRVFCANPYAFQRTGATEITIYIHHHVREDAILLFGFQDREEQALFRQLLDVSGIGPRVALGILSGGRPAALVMAIQTEDFGYLTRMPGIGKKTAQRIVLDLKDKLGSFASSPGDLSGLDDATHITPSPNGPTGALAAVKDGLLALGFSEAEVARIWAQLQQESVATQNEDTLIKIALKLLYRG